MVIDLATINFVPGQGGEAVIRTLDVTENGTYNAPSGVDGYNPVRVSVSGGGSITPQEQAALDTLVDSSKGVLYTEELAPRTANYMPGFDYSGYNQCLSKVGDDVYLNLWGSSLYKWNYDLMKFDFLCNYSGTPYPIWRDNSGRLYCGVNIQITDETTGATEAVDLGLEVGEYYNSTGTYDNIVIGHSGIYLVNFSGDCKKFDETDQEFKTYTINWPQGIYFDRVMYVVGLKEYEGHLINVVGGVMYEFVEESDYIDVVALDTPYFQIDSIGSYSYEGYYFHKCGDDYYYLVSDQHFKLVEGSWVTNTIDRAGWNDMNFIIYGADTDNYLIGYELTEENRHICLTNPGSTSYVHTYWSEAGRVAVDLSSDQSIKGTKVFDTIIVDSLGTDFIHPKNDRISIGTIFTNVNVNSKSFSISTTSGQAKLDSKSIATTDKCILNKTYEDYGPEFTALSSAFVPYDKDLYFKAPFTDPNTGIDEEHLFVIIDGVWNRLDGNTFTPVTFTYSPGIGRMVFDTFYGPVYIDSFGNIYEWSKSDSDFNYKILDAEYAEIHPGYSEVWRESEMYLRSGDTYKLEFGDGSALWTSDPVVNYPGVGRSVWMDTGSGGTTWYFCQNGYIYNFDFDNKEFNQDRQWLNDSYYNIFSYVSDVFFKYDGVIYILNPIYDSTDPSSEPYTATDIATNNVANSYIGSVGDKMMTVIDNKIGYVYGLEEELPEVPASNGVYVLQATRVGDVITYEWVSTGV